MNRVIDLNRLNKSYKIALGLVALLSIVGQAIIQYSLQQSLEDSRLINLAGRQRMLSQKITKEFLLAERDGERPSRANRDLIDWEKSHRSIFTGRIHSAFGNNAELKELSEEVIARFQSLKIVMRGYQEGRNSIQAVLQQESIFLHAMDKFVFFIDELSHDKVVKLRIIEAVLFLLTLMVLFVEARYIFGKVMRALQDQASKNLFLVQKTAHRDRLETLGKMSAGIAHEVLNPLTYTKSNLQMIQSQMKELTPEQQKMLQHSLDGIEHAATIVSGLKDVAKSSPRRDQVIDLVALCKSCARLVAIQNQSKKDVNLDLRNVDLFKGNSMAWTQIVVNFLQNAVEACEGDLSLVKIVLRQRDSVVRLSVIDAGMGVGEEKVEEIFDAFYTGKEDNTGLGLFIARELAEEIGAKIRVGKNYPRGCRFSVGYRLNESNL